MTDPTAAFLSGLAAQGQPQAAFAALEALTRQLVGVKLFTIMTSDTVTRLAERVYSSHPEDYPVSGTKPYNETYWSDITLRQQKTFVANTIEAIAEVFPDYALIDSLGCQSVINVPIVVDGLVIGTINCLHEAGYYTPERVEAAEALKLPGAICMLLADRDRARSMPA
ncbi:GAF domain-containing protein [Rhizobium sp. CC-YZS058]|uniref:GAF domain-containing protein n=1 Tax=Rhizobium sp. CC-YZS058 TaxID=3042153 RepID=UPI002B053314|nr:GAF domain-containing protein [Rhizobium sp. CC-YZS058]MEA3536764.1 GAF domain-containing protein [Rhizobium sp. CC-YZS058]